MERTIMIFPRFDNMDIINSIRSKYDPLADLVMPHITIVFPFLSKMSNEDISTILNRELMDISPFELVLEGFSKQENPYGNYLFLNVTKGEKIIQEIHQRLYKNEFKIFDIGLNYKPHLTVGKFLDKDLLNRAYADVNSINSKFITIVDRICVEEIGEDEKSIIVIEKKLI